MEKIINNARYTFRGKKNMNKKCKIRIWLALVGIVVLAGVVWGRHSNTVQKFLNREIPEHTDIIELELTDFKQEEEYRFCKIPWEASLDEVKTMVPYTLLEDPGRQSTSENHAFYVSAADYRLKSKTATAVYEFLNDKLIGVQLVFSSAENAVEQFKPIISEATEMFGTASETFENENKGDVIYLWESDYTTLEIDSINIDGAKLMIFISYAEE
jgi:hypothetical protein